MYVSSKFFCVVVSVTFVLLYFNSHLIKVCHVLLRHGVDPAIISLQGFTAAQMATESIQQLLQVG